jgi:hypothetical protein
MRSASIQVALAAAFLAAMQSLSRAADEPAATPSPAAPVAPLTMLPDSLEDEKPLFSEADSVALAGYRLDDARLARFEVVIAAMDAQAKNDEALRTELEHDESKTDGIDRFVESIEKDKPKMLAIIKSAGMTPREFVMTSFSLTLAMVYADLLRVQPATPLPEYVVRENVGFVRKNEERLAKLFEALNHN